MKTNKQDFNKNYDKKETCLKNSIHQSLVPYAATKLHELMLEASNLKSVKFSTCQYYVTKKENNKENVSVSVHPNFHRVRIVTVNSERMFCNCSFSPINSIPCVHVLHVAKLSCEYKCPTIKDVSVVWWKDYYKFRFDKECEDSYPKCVINVFIILRLREKNGLQIDSQHYEMIPIVEALDIPNIFKKYMKEGVCPRNHASVNKGDFNDGALMGLSQKKQSIYHSGWRK